MATISELEKKVDSLATEVAMLRVRLDSEDGVYILTDEERKEIQEGLAEAKRGEYATDDEVEAVFKKFRSL